MMISLNEHIEYLMMHHDCIVIPGWGSLVAQYSDSSFNSSACTIQKPLRKVGFNASVNHNDALLAQSIVRRERVSYDQAVRYIEQSVKSYKKLLASGGEFGLGRLGFFHSDNEGRIEFVPFEHEMCNDQYFGLRSFQFTPLSQLGKAQDETKESANVIRYNWWNSRVWQTAASIVLLLGLSILLTTPIFIDRNNQNLATLNFPSVSKPHHEVIDWSNTKSDLAVALPEQAQAEKLLAEQRQAAREEYASQNNLLLNEGGTYYLVIASLSNAEEVNLFLKYHQDIAAHTQILRQGKHFHVYVARSFEQSRLYRFKAQLPPKYGNAWVCN